MGLFDFLKDAGEDLEAQETAREREKAASLARQIMILELKVENLEVGFDDGVVTVRGTTPSQEEREKIVLTLGNVRGVAQVDDQLTVEKPQAEAVFYTVKSGDTLSGIAKQHYGNAGKYPVIFEANRPMLKDPNRIYPGQVLRIPPLEG